MSKTIRVDEVAYDELDKIRGKGDTFSDAIERLIRLKKAARQLELELRRCMSAEGYQRFMADESKTTE